jgi:hypothetical protein
VSIKGSDYKWLKDALDRGDLPLVKATVAQSARRGRSLERCHPFGIGLDRPMKLRRLAA